MIITSLFEFHQERGTEEEAQYHTVRTRDCLCSRAVI